MNDDQKSGRARLSELMAKFEQLWREPWRVWFPDGKGDSALRICGSSRSWPSTGIRAARGASSISSRW